MFVHPNKKAPCSAVDNQFDAASLVWNHSVMEPGDSVAPDFRLVFESVPECCLILKPDAPRFTIVAMTDAYNKVTMTQRTDMVGKGLFEVFPDNPNDPKADGVRNISESFMRVLELKALDRMPVIKYDIARPAAEGGGFEVRYWSPENSPLIGESGEVLYIINLVSDVTQYETLIQTYGSPAGPDVQDFAGHSTQIERLNKLMLDREIKMAELKQEILELKKQK